MKQYSGVFSFLNVDFYLGTTKTEFILISTLKKLRPLKVKSLDNTRLGQLHNPPWPRVTSGDCVLIEACGKVG